MPPPGRRPPLQIWRQPSKPRKLRVGICWFYRAADVPPKAAKKGELSRDPRRVGVGSCMPACLHACPPAACGPPAPGLWLSAAHPGPFPNAQLYVQLPAAHHHQRRARGGRALHPPPRHRLVPGAAGPAAHHALRRGRGQVGCTGLAFAWPGATGCLLLLGPSGASRQRAADLLPRRHSRLRPGFIVTQAYDAAAQRLYAIGDPQLAKRSPELAKQVGRGRCLGGTLFLLAWCRSPGLACTAGPAAGSHFCA